MRYWNFNLKNISLKTFIQSIERFCRIFGVSETFPMEQCIQLSEPSADVCDVLGRRCRDGRNVHCKAVLSLGAVDGCCHCCCSCCYATGWWRHQRLLLLLLLFVFTMSSWSMLLTTAVAAVSRLVRLAASFCVPCCTDMPRLKGIEWMEWKTASWTE